MPCSACKNEARCDSAGLCQIYRQELPAPSCWCQATGDEKHAKCCPLHESRPGVEEARAARKATAGVATPAPALTKADAVRIAQEVGMLGDVVLNGPSLVRFAERVRALGVKEGQR